MPMYRFECDRCGGEELAVIAIADLDSIKAALPLVEHSAVGLLACFDGYPNTACGGQLHQVYGVNVNLGMREHYSDQLDAHVTSERQFNDTLKRQAEEYSARTGMEVSYETVDPTDPKAAGVTDAGLESQERAHHDAAAAVGEHKVRSFT